MVSHLDIYNAYIHMRVYMLLLVIVNMGCRAVYLVCSHLYFKNRITYISIYSITLLLFYNLSGIFDVFGISHICESMFGFDIFFF